MDRLADEDRPRLGGVLQPRGDISHITDHRIIHRRILGDWAKHDGPGVYTDSHRQLRALGISCLAVFAKRPLYAERRQKPAADMVFVSERGPEQSNECIAGKLRRRTPVAAHLGKARFEKRVDKVAHPLESQAFGQRGRVDDVAEQYCDLASFRRAEC